MTTVPHVNSQDADTIAKIVDRTMRALTGTIDRAMRVDLAMSLTTAHAHNPLRLEEMLTARPGDLTHDVLGIHQNLNRRTGGFRECFQPRFAVRS